MKWLNTVSLSENEFLYRSTLRTSWVFIIMGMPFAINHILKGNLALSFYSLAVIIIMAINVWRTLRFKQYHTSLILFGMVPAVLLFLLESTRSQGFIGVLWSFPAIICCFFMLPLRMAWLASSFMLCVILPNVWLVFGAGLAIRITITLMMVLAFAAIFVGVIDAQQEKLKAMAITDKLTGLRNRHTLKDAINLAIARFSRSNIPVSLVTLDVDLFKTINDQHGHDVGDEVLKGVASVLKHRCRDADLAFRLGGEEFLVLLYDASTHHASAFAEELRSAVESISLVPGQKVTASFGVAELTKEDNSQSWLKRCDQHLYHAKSEGRNCVVNNIPDVALIRSS